MASWGRRQLRGTVLFFLVAVLLAIVALRRRALSRDHHITPDLLQHHADFATAGKSAPASKEVASICRSHGFLPYGKTRTVYDLVLFSTELDWLEIRLHTLAPYVDYFVVVESPTTFTGKPKPLLLKDNWDRFVPFHDKIIHRVVVDPINSTRIWDHEDYMRNSLLDNVFPSLVGTAQEAHKYDALVVGDIDEILRPSAMLLMRYCDVPARLTLRTHMYYYSFQWLHRGQQWAHPDATLYGGSVSNTISPNALRMGLLGPGLLPLAAFSRWWSRATLWNAGWHCSSCFATIAETRTKMHSFSHQGWNTANNRDAKVIIERVRNGLDLFSRESELYERIENNDDIPGYVLQQHQEKGRFEYLLDRDAKEAGFEDWDTVMLND